MKYRFIEPTQTGLATIELNLGKQPHRILRVKFGDVVELNVEEYSHVKLMFVPVKENPIDSFEKAKEVTNKIITEPLEQTLKEYEEVIVEELDEIDDFVEDNYTCDEEQPEQEVIEEEKAMSTIDPRILSSLEMIDKLDTDSNNDYSNVILTTSYTGTNYAEQEVIEEEQAVKDLESMTYLELKQILKDRGLETTGKKSDLLERLKNN